MFFKPGAACPPAQFAPADVGFAGLGVILFADEVIECAEESPRFPGGGEVDGVTDKLIRICLSTANMKIRIQRVSTRKSLPNLSVKSGFSTFSDLFDQRLDASPVTARTPGQRYQQGGR